MSDTLFFFEEDGWNQTDISQILDDILQEAAFQETDNTIIDNLERNSSPSSGSTTKRREIVKESERKRRVRLNDQIKQLQDLLFPNQIAKRITKEDILQKAIDQLKERSCNNNNIVQPSKSIERVLKKQKITENLQCTYNRHPLSLQEIQIGFSVLFQQMTDKLMEFNSNRNDNTFKTMFSTVDELANKSQNLELMLASSTTGTVYYSFISLQPTEAIRSYTKGIYVYNKIQQMNKMNKNKIEPIADELIGGVDIGVTLLVDRACVLVSLGDFVRANESWSEAQNLANKLKHKETINYLFVTSLLYFYHRGEPVPKEIVHSVMETSKIVELKGLAACFHGYHLLNESQWEEGIKYVEDGVKDFQHLYGNCGDICLGFILLNAYLQSGYIEKGLKCANDLIQRSNEVGVTGPFGTAELIRLKGELLRIKYSPNLTMDQFDELDLLYQSAITVASSKQTVLIHLRSLTSMAHFYADHASSIRKQKVRQDIMEQIKKIEEISPTKSVISDIILAQQALESLNL